MTDDSKPSFLLAKQPPIPPITPSSSLLAFQRYGLQHEIIRCVLRYHGRYHRQRRRSRVLSSLCGRDGQTKFPRLPMFQWHAFLLPRGQSRRRSQCPSRRCLQTGLPEARRRHCRSESCCGGCETIGCDANSGLYKISGCFFNSGGKPDPFVGGQVGPFSDCWDELIANQVSFDTGPSAEVNFVSNQYAVGNPVGVHQIGMFFAGDRGSNC
jgi:hypothetical protein